MRKETFWARVVLLLAVIAGASYMLSWDQGLPDAVSTVWKGAGVSLLAVYAAMRAQSLDGWMLFAIMALGALGDVLLETSGLTVGAVAFLCGHLVAIALYLRHRRGALSPSQKLLALVLVPATVVIAWLLPADRGFAPGVALYATGLSVMAATAWTSRFSRARVGLGAVMFLVSDLLIFARVGPLAGVSWIGVAVWTLYFLGQFLICIGVAGALTRWTSREAPDLAQAPGAPA